MAATPKKDRIEELRRKKEEAERVMKELEQEIELIEMDDWGEVKELSKMDVAEAVEKCLKRKFDAIDEKLEEILKKFKTLEERIGEGGEAAATAGTATVEEKEGEEVAQKVLVVSEEDEDEDEDEDEEDWEEEVVEKDLV